MSFTRHNNYEVPDGGVQNWDASLNENFELAELGPTIRATAGLTISINNVVYIGEDAKFALAISTGLTVTQTRYIGFSTTEINREVDGYARISGTVKDPDWFFTPGHPVYLSAQTSGGLTTISPGLWHSIGTTNMVAFAIQTNEILIRPYSW
jgi:hypothetical protein